MSESTAATGPSIPAGGLKSEDAGANGATNPVRVESSTYLLNDPKLREVLLSDAGVESLLGRLKQSIHTVKEVSAYIKKMATIEAEHSAHLKKASRTMTDLIKRPEVKKGTCQSQVLNILKSTDRYGDAGITFIDTMHRIHDELVDVVRSMERQRKTTKETALRHEKTLVDAEREVEKAKVKYDTACEDLEKARTSDPNKSKLGFKNKSEEELHRRMTIAEVDYQQKVDVCQRTRKELVSKLRVEDVRRLQGLILECDNALSLQLMRFSNLFETLQLNRGFVIAPIKPQNSPTANLSIKEMAGKIDSELDFYNYVCAIPKSRTNLNRAPVVFKKHPTLGGSSGGGSSGNASGSRGPSGAAKGPSSPAYIGKPSYGSSPNSGSGNGYGSSMGSSAADRKVSTASATSNSSVPPPSKIISSGTAKTGPVLGVARQANMVSQSPVPPTASASASTPPTISSSAVPPSFDPGTLAAKDQQPALAPSGDTFMGGSGTGTIIGGPGGTAKGVPYDPSKHGLAVYGTALEDLLDYEEGTVPRVVYQCVQAIDNFGLEVEGIYRTNGNKDQVAEIRREFDVDAAAVDLLRPNNGVNDIHSVASALKQYFQALPDPLLTREYHREFLTAANIQDEIRRRDSIHAIINNLPDPNYTTLRYLIFHLYRLQERSEINKMDVTNLGIIWGPVLMNADHQNVGELAVQSRTIQTILINAYAIFEAE